MAHPVERGAITVDGRLDEPAWRQYPPVSGFVQLTPKTGEPEEGKTDVWILYDDQYLYVGAAMTDPEPAQIQADERRRDSTFSRSDTFGFVVDPFHDHQNGFFFETNPFGAKSDGLVSQEGAFVNMDWDGLWDVAAERTLEGWSAEFRIPLETLRYQKGEKQVWGIQFRRQVPHLKQISFWNPMTTEQTFFMISKGGHLEGINPSASESKLFIKPYVKGSYQVVQGDSAGSAFGLDGGGDVRYAMKSNSTLDLTWRTDFAETESDLFQINLTRFPLYYPEKREFFLESSGFFDFGISGRIQPFFSRTIGLNSSSFLPVPILGGLKFTGKGDGYGVGALSMATRSDSGNEGEQFSVVRFSRDIGVRSRAGFLFTDRNGVDLNKDETAGGDFFAGVHPDVDLQGFFIKSGMNGAASGTANAGFAEIYWHDPVWRIRLNHLHIDQNFNPGTGFVRQADLDETYGYIDYHPQPKSGAVREYGFKSEVTYQGDSGGDFLYRSSYWRGQANFVNGDFLLTSIDFQREYLPVYFAIRPAITIPPGEYVYTQWNIIYSSDPTRSFSATASYLGGGFYGGEKESAVLNLTWGVIGTLKAGLAAEVDWVYLPWGDFVAEVVSQDLRWDLTNQMSLAMLTQWDRESQELSGNFRFIWEYREGSKFYLVINPTRADPQTTTVIVAKLTYLLKK